ncbi:MAG: GntR family transcriptional regulator [Rhizobiaceae bacterium]
MVDEPKQSGSNDETIGNIYHQIYLAVIEQRLPPGTKLAEGKLAQIFGVSRARIRDVLARLVFEGIVEHVPQKGAHVARPTPTQARNVIEMRRMIEPGIVTRLISTLNDAKIGALMDHLEAEADARREKDAQLIIRLSGDFHCLLGTLCENEFLARSIRELSTLTCLMISLYNAPTREACRDDEHAQIVAAIVDRDEARASQLMIDHLEHIEASLMLNQAVDATDLDKVFASVNFRATRRQPETVEG